MPHSLTDFTSKISLVLLCEKGYNELTIQEGGMGMILADKQIRTLGERLIVPFASDQVQNICYDLTTEAFCSAPGSETDEITLAPGDSVFVKTEERIILPGNMVGIVCLRNSRIRQGLDLKAPIYQPGHDTKIFFRLTNISHQAIQLDCGKGIASIMFEELSVEVEQPYNGTFQSEFEFKGMGAYTSSLSKDMTNIAEKVDHVKSIEKSIYGNVLALMAIFVAIFSLINVNISLTVQNVGAKILLTMNFATVGSIGFLVAVINTVLPSGKYRVWVWLVCILAFAAAIAVQFVLP